MNECNAFPIGSRKWHICRHEADLPPAKMDAYRVAWGLAPLLPPEPPREPFEQPIPELIFHGRSLSDGSASIGHKQYGPGSELMAIYHAAGVPSCEACRDLAQRMNDWGAAECRQRVEEIVADILPRAMEWLDNQYPWAAKLLPSIISVPAASFKIRNDVLKAIETFETTVSERRAKKLDILTGQPRKGCSSCGGGSAQPQMRKVQNNLAAIPLVGKPIDRSRLVEHILYHVMPLAGDTEWVWRRHCDWLREVRGNFNGRLIVGIVTPGEMDAYQYLPPDAVYEALAGLDAEFIEAPNDTGGRKNRKGVRQGIGEGVLFPLMLRQLQTSDPDQIAYYGHCKGVTRPQTPLDGAIHKWAEAMFETLFRNQWAVVEALDTAGVCGPFRMRGGYRDGGPGIGSKWFFSGTFFATRLADAFARNWSYLPRHYGCVEQWPRLNFDQATQSKCLFFDTVLNLYDEPYWQTTVTPRLEQWRAARVASRTT